MREYLTVESYINAICVSAVVLNSQNDRQCHRIFWSCTLLNFLLNLLIDMIAEMILFRSTFMNSTKQVSEDMTLHYHSPKLISEIHET